MDSIIDAGRTKDGHKDIPFKAVRKGAISIKWSNEQQVYLIHSDESITIQFSTPRFASDQNNFTQARHENDQDTDHELIKLIERLGGCMDDRDPIAAMQKLRAQVLTKILGSRTPLRWLPAFLQKWQLLLRSMDGRDGAELASTNLVDYCQEIVALAGSWKLIGDIIQARSTLGKCFEVTRRHLKAPFAKPMPFEDGENQELRYVAIAAKKLLLECVAFQTSLARNKELFGRHNAPPYIQASLTKAFWMLFRQAPLSIEIALLLAHSLMKQREFTLVIRFLEQSHLSGESAELTLIHARALEYVGFYRQAIEIAEQYADQRSNDNVISVEALEVHCNRMKKLLDCREKADECLRLDQYEKAVSRYQECLALVDSADRKQLAVLLFGHANALLGLEQVFAAINDLRKILQLDPTNKIASIRLQTACLQQETERIKKELSRQQSGHKLPSTW